MFNQIKLDSRFYRSGELNEFCREKIHQKTTESWKRETYRFILDLTDNSDYIFQKTSGTTGNPKTIRLPKQMLYESAKNTIQFFNLQKNQTAVLCLPVQYIAGKMMIIRAMVAGMNLLLVEPTSKPDFNGIDHIDFCAMVPMQVLNLINEGKWPELKWLIIGGAAISPKLKSELHKLNTGIYESFGMAETGSHIALKRVNGDHPDEFFTPLPGISVSTDSQGCLVIAGSFLPHQIVTRDLVEIREGNRFKWLGRLDHTINTGGIKIQTEELENQIQNILNIPCAISWKKDELLGQKMVLFLECHRKIDPVEIQKSLSVLIPRNLIPRDIRLLKSLPRNSSLKVNRLALQNLVD